MRTRRVGLVAAWLGATILSVVLASQAVGLVRDQVTDRPSRAASTLLPTTVTQAAPPTTSLDPGVPPSDERPLTPSTTTTAPPPQSTTTITSATSPTTTRPPSDGTTTTVSTVEKVFTLVGGTVRVACRGDDIEFRAASPKPGFDADVDKRGPEEVEVTFESDGHRSDFRAKCGDDGIEQHIEERNESSHDDEG